MVDSEPTEIQQPPEMATRLYEQINDLWVTPEVEKRNGEGAPMPSQALVVFGADSEVHVFLGPEAEIVVDVEAARPVEEGQEVTLTDVRSIQGLRPMNVSDDAGWVLYTSIGGHVWVAFDLRRNRGRAKNLIEQAEEFWAVAADSFNAHRFRPCLVNAYVAAELAVKAKMLLFHGRSGLRSHSGRQRWLAQWAGLGNTSRAHSSALGQLASLQKAARYEDESIAVEREQVSNLLDSVGGLISETRDELE